MGADGIEIIDLESLVGQLGIPPDGDHGTRLRLIGGAGIACEAGQALGLTVRRYDRYNNRLRLGGGLCRDNVSLLRGRAKRMRHDDQ